MITRVNTALMMCILVFIAAGFKLFLSFCLFSFPYENLYFTIRHTVLRSGKNRQPFTYLLRLSSSCPGRDIGRRDFSTGVDRWQLSLHHVKLGSFCVGLP